MWMTFEQMLRLPELLAGYRHFIRQTKPALVIHTNWQSLLTIAPFLEPARDFFWLHDIVPDKPQYRRVFGWLGTRLRCFIAVSDAVRRSLLRVGIAEHKVCVIHNGILDPAADEGPLRRQADHSIIGIVGQMGAWKGHEDLFDAFAMVLHSHPATELHVFGKGSDEFQDNLKERAASLGISNNIAWRGFIEDRAVIYRSMDVCVVPSRFEEPFGLVVIEAGFFGLPVIATRRGGLPEIIEDRVTGFLVDSERPKQLADCLETLLSRPQLRREMGTKARKRAVLHFERERFLGDFIRLLKPIDF